MVPKYSVVTINIGSYELVREIEVKSENAEYILITDDPNLKSETWTIKLVENKYPKDNFYTVFNIRYNIFDYINTDIAFVIDGSIKIVNNLDIFIEKMEENNADCCLFLHNFNWTLKQEYIAWTEWRNYPDEQVEKIKKIIGDYWFYDHKGLFVRTAMIQKNTNDINKWNQLSFEYCKLLKYNKDSEVDRVDQTISSYILQKYFYDTIRPIYVSIELLNTGKYLQWFGHGNNRRLYSIPNNNIRSIFKPYFFDKDVATIEL